MAQTMINFRMDSDVKKKLECICDELGLSLSTAFNIFARKMIRDERIPFDVSIESFYNKTNMAILEKSINQLKEGKIIEKTLDELEVMENE